MLFIYNISQSYSHLYLTIFFNCRVKSRLHSRLHTYTNFNVILVGIFGVIVLYANFLSDRTAYLKFCSAGVSITSMHVAYRVLSDRIKIEPNRQRNRSKTDHRSFTPAI